MQVFAFVDTNVLLHYQFFADVDWAAQLGVDAVTLVFAPVVLSELDRHKWNGSRREKARAKTVLKRLDSLELSPAPVAVRSGVAALAVVAEPGDAVFAQHRLDRHVADDRLLASLLSFDGAAPGDRVLVLTGDSGLRVKARARPIEVAMPDESLESPAEPDDVERELEKTRRELAEFKGAAPDLRLTFAGGDTHGQFTVKLVQAFDAVTLQRLLEDWRAKHPHIGGMPDSIEIPAGFGGGTIRLPNFTGIPGFVSAEDAAAHNTDLDKVYARYERFLQEWPAAVNRLARVLPLNLVLENAGTAPADDVDVQLWTDAVGSWIEELPDLPSPPAGPKRRSLYDSILDVRAPYLDHFPAGALVHPAANVDGPNIEGEDSKQRVQYDIKRVKHHVPCELPVVYFQFASDEDVASFTVTVQIVAANIHKPAVRSLHVEVKRAEPAAPPEPGRLAARDEDDDEDDDQNGS